MLTFLKIAWRDLWRHRLRSGLTLAAIIFGSALTLFFMAWAHGGHQGMIRSAISLFTGYLQVHRAGYQMEPIVSHSMPLNQQVIEYLDGSQLVTGYSPRLCTETLVQAGNNISGTKICGVIPEKEIKTSRVAQTFFPEMTKTPKGIKTSRRYSGKFLSGSETGGAVIGQDLAKYLQVEIGDRVSILTQDNYGSMAAGNFKIKGIFKSGSPEYDARLMMVNLPELQDLLFLPGQITHIVVMTSDATAIPKIEKEIYQRTSGEQGPWRIENMSGGLWKIKVQKPNLGMDSPLQITDQEILKKALGRVPGVEAYSMQVSLELWFYGKSVPVCGVVAEHEKTVQGLFPKETEKFASNDWVVLKQWIAQRLGKKIGDPLIFTGVNYLGENFELRLKLAGTFESPAKPDAYVPLALLQEKLALGENVNQALVKLSSRIPAGQAEADILSRLNYEVIPWQELAPDVVQAVELDNVGAVLWLLILLLVIAFVFLLTILMSVLERARQFGIMKAVGTRPGEIFLVIFYESILLGLLGTVIGMVLGAIPSLYFTYVPLDLSAFGADMGEMMEYMGFEPFLYAKLEPSMFFYTALINFSFVIIMSIPPALRASRTKPAQTLRLQ